MKISLGRSRNEHVEIISSIIFGAIGGYAVSFIRIDQWFPITFFISFVFFATGIIFALRASFKVSEDTRLNRELLEKARKELEDAIEKKAQQVKQEAHADAVVSALVFG